MDATALLCNICPKKPAFSDVSHLLTHVSSKAHLSHYFKLQVRSHQDPQAISLLEEYDLWYKSNDLAKLLSDRMSSKDSRRKRSQRHPPVKAKVNTTDTTPESKGPLTTVVSSLQASFPAYLDPRLSSSFLESGLLTANDDPAVSTSFDLAPRSIPELHNQPGPGPGLFTADSLQEHTSTISKPWKQEDIFDSGEEGGPVLHYTLHSVRTLADMEDMDHQPSHNRWSYDPFIDDSANDRDKERSDEISRLKGVLWPGMDIFDSATQQMKRKRNQKKDESILMMMEKTSLCVEPTELVFSPTGVLRKQRVISGNVEDTSPLKGETPIPKRRPKRVLAQADPNIPRGQDRKRSKRIGQKASSRSGATSKHKASFEQDSLAQEPIRVRNPSHNTDLDEFSLTFREGESKAKNSVHVFRDNAGLRKPDSTGYPYKGEFTARASNSTDQHQRHIRGELESDDLLPLISTAREALSFSGGHARIAAGKENIEPLLSMQGRVDPLVGCQSPVLRRQMPSDIGYPPHCFLSDSQNIGLSPFKGNGSSSGYSYNPLAGSFAKFNPEENPIYTPAPNDRLMSNFTLTTSPGATTSDIEGDDFERLYLDGSSI